MNHVTLLAIAIAALFAAQSWLSIWSRKADKMRHVAIGLFVLGLPLLGFAALDSLSWARPLWAMWDLHGNVKVIGAKLVEGEAIYVYADTGEDEPRSIRLPWNTQTAESLQGLFADPKNQGQAMMHAGDGLDQHPPEFWPVPQESSPPKIPAPEAPHLDISAS